MYVALCDDINFISAHVNEFIFSDSESAIVETVPRHTPFTDDLEIHPAASSKRFPEESDIVESDHHKIGGASFWLHEHPSSSRSLVAQIGFPAMDDLPLSVDWPTAGYTTEVIWDSRAQAFGVVWRFHA
ncbi:MAG: hypothetical protein CMO80_18370 [Verrucomicrobiales bacterium]|nr:hypothetical protein [Verrucomicrobiales bacterium]